MDRSDTRVSRSDETAGPQYCADDQEALWLAVMQRDGGGDGEFVYGVSTTGIYCRPSCPSRRPQRKNVRFFGTAAEAANAGFRPCRRCAPDQVVSPTVALIQQAKLSIERIVGDPDGGPARLGRLAAEVGVSAGHLQREFKKTTGQTPREYAESLRIGQLRGELRSGAAVTTALFDSGFSSSSRLYDRSSRLLGMTPGAYRTGGRGLTVTYAIDDCALGRIVVATTDRGVCAVALADDDGRLVSFLRDELPEADLRRDDQANRPWMDILISAVGGAKANTVTIPVDSAGTEFQRRVWAALREIGVGERLTYSAIARSIGQPTAARAVAHACATNPVAVLIPCHRVVRTDGGLGGYRWGLDRKRALLDSERSAAREG